MGNVRNLTLTSARHPNFLRIWHEKCHYISVVSMFRCLNKILRRMQLGALTGDRTLSCQKNSNFRHLIYFRHKIYEGEIGEARNFYTLFRRRDTRTLTCYRTPTFVDVFLSVVCLTI